MHLELRTTHLDKPFTSILHRHQMYVLNINQQFPVSIQLVLLNINFVLRNTY